ncbi:MAG: hypothetical protein NW203_06400 [Hyphomonadaceae bacterium]|nr:hypothetical protein [Hyphomonadaceae bacterium]
MTIAIDTRTTFQLSRRASTGATLRRAALFAATMAAVVAATALSDPAPLLRADAELAMLLRGMAALKALLAIAAFAAVFWRFGAPIGISLGVVYAASTAMMAAGAALIWGLSHIGFTAIAFHAALIALAFAALRDGRIAALTTKKRRAG